MPRGEFQAGAAVVPPQPAQRNGRPVFSAVKHDVGSERHQGEDGDDTANMGKFTVSHFAHGLPPDVIV